MLIDQINHSTPRRIFTSSKKHQSTSDHRQIQSPHLDQENVGVGPIRTKKHRVHERASISRNVNCQPELVYPRASSPMTSVHPGLTYLSFVDFPVENGMVCSRNPLANIAQNVVTAKADYPKRRPAIRTASSSDVPRVETKFQPLNSPYKPWRPW